MANKEVADLGHLAWLVKSRSENQAVSLELHKVLHENAAIIDGDGDIANIAQAMVAVCFSLWRSVFLSEVGFEIEASAHEARTFLHSLILHNSVTYMTDYHSREWSFIYYVNSARYRLERISNERSDILPAYKYSAGTESAKELWTDTHDSLQTAVNNFGRILKAKRAEGG